MELAQTSNLPRLNTVSEQWRQYSKEREIAQGNAEDWMNTQDGG